MHKGLMLIVWLLGFAAMGQQASAQETGRDIYMKRCFWCHGEKGDGDGPAVAGMFPRPRDFIRAEYKIRSTPDGQLPTDEDLFRVISRGMPGTPMPGWDEVLSDEQRWQLVSYLKSLSARFQSEEPEPLTVPGGTGSAERGREIYRSARCFMCHGDSGRGDGGITTALDFEWGLPYSARDFSRGWTFKGGHELRDIYLRITGGLNGTPMGPYRELLSDEDRWDLAHYVASFDREPSGTSDEFVIMAAHIREEIPDTAESPSWQAARPTQVPLAGQVILDPPSRWWTPTVASVSVRALWNGRSVGFLLEWNDPTGPDQAFPDWALLQFAADEQTKPYFLFGSPDIPVKLWRWQAGNSSEEWTAAGGGKIESHPPSFEANSSWKEGRWHVVLRRSLEGEPRFEPGEFVPVLLSIGDGANAEVGNTRSISTWLYATLERPPSARSWLAALVGLVGAVIVEIWFLQRVSSSKKC